MFRKIKSRITELIQKESVFIQTESSIYSSLEFIEKNFKHGNYTFHMCKNYVVVFVWRKRFIFVAYIVDLARDELSSIFSDYDIKFVEYDNADINKFYAERVAYEGMQLMISSRNFLNNIKL